MGDGEGGWEHVDSSQNAHNESQVHHLEAE